MPGPIEHEALANMGTFALCGSYCARLLPPLYVLAAAWPGRVVHDTRGGGEETPASGPIKRVHRLVGSAARSVPSVSRPHRLPIGRKNHAGKLRSSRGTRNRSYAIRNHSLCSPAAQPRLDCAMRIQLERDYGL